MNIGLKPCPLWAKKLKLMPCLEKFRSPLRGSAVAPGALPHRSTALQLFALWVEYSEF